MKIKVGQSQEYANPDVPSQLFIYVYKGQVSVMVSSKLNTVSKGDLLVVNQFDNSLVTIHGIENSELIICNIDN